jgi:hypothetical protein
MNAEFAENGRARDRQRGLSSAKRSIYYPFDLHSTRVLATYLNGREVYADKAK